MIARVTVVLLCGIGLYASAFMARKTRRAVRGELTEPSVVQTSRARAIGGVPNVAFGLAYYATLAIATPFLTVRPVFWLAFGASVVAAAFSAYLAYSLLFITRMSCKFCWMGHVVNWSLIVVLWTQHPATT